jgi:putative pyruvate formate lyase activating enzyme
VNRLRGEVGFCGQTAVITAARAALHYWEEPCISGTAGSGAVFFSGCSLRCVFCQNHEIALGQTGKEISVHHLAEIFLRLQNEQHANNINLVTPTHFVPQIVLGLQEAKRNGLHIPIVYNTGSYETLQTLQMLDGLIDIYLPDLKYYDSAISMRYADAPEYFQHASAAIAEMYRQVGSPRFQDSPSGDSATSDLSDLSENSLMTRGVIVRHLLLPGCTADSQKIIQYLYQTYRDAVFISIMNQYTPVHPPRDFPELQRKVSPSEYDAVVDYALSLGVENAFIQDGETAEESFIPPFDCEGI